MSLAPAGTSFRPAVVNGQPAFITVIERRPRNVVTLETVGDVLSNIYVVVNPDKLARVERPDAAGDVSVARDPPPLPPRRRRNGERSSGAKG